MSSSERRKGKPGKVWDAVMNWTAGGSGFSREQFHAYNDGQELPVTTQASSNRRCERPATAGSTPAPRRVDIGEIGKRSTVIERLEEKVAKLERILQETTVKLTSVATKADSIERLKIKVVGLDEFVQGKMLEGNITGSPRSPRKARDVGFLTGKVVELNQLLQEKIDQLFNVEHTAHEQIARKEEDNIRLEAEVAQLNRLLREKAAEHSSAERAANERIENQKREIGRLEAEVARLNHLQEQPAKTSSAEDAENKQEAIHRDLSTSDQNQRDEKRTETVPRYPSTEDEPTIKLPSPTIVRKPDTISVAEVADLVRISNSQIEQTSSLILDSLSYREPPISSDELQDVLDELNDYIGPWLCNDLRSKSNEFNMEPDPLITQLTLQTGLVNACSYIINYGIPPADGVTLSRIHANMAEAGQAVADTWKALARTYTTTSQSESWEANRKYLTGITLKLITAVGGSLEGGGALPPQYNEKLEDIVKKALELHRIVSRDVVSMELVTYTIPCDAEFDPSRMEDTEGGGDETGSTTQDTVICTLEMGLQCRKRKENGSGEDWA
ncbi:hypothetical protein JOM56_002860 [Amanita muscaria]